MFEIPWLVPDEGIPIYDVMPDGQQFLLLAPTGNANAPTMTVITHWQAELSGAKN